MAVSFYVQNTTETTANIYVRVDSSYSAYRVYVRLSSSSTAVVYDEWFSGISANFAAYVEGLEPGTDYTVNVAYNTSATATGATWVGSQTFSTDQEVVTYYVTLNFNANGGSGAPSSRTYTGTSSSIQVTLPSTTPTRSGYEFLGWSTSSTATSPAYYAGTTYNNWWGSTSSSYSQTLYAVWQQSTYSVTIVYDANGGTGAPSSQAVTGTSSSLSVTLSSTKPTRDGYVFQGWTDNEGSTIAEYSAGQTLSSVYATTSGYEWILYAVWAESTAGTVWVFYDGVWKRGTPYVFYDGVWKKATPYVFYDGVWKTSS